MNEEENKGKRIKQIIIYIIVLLSVLCCSIFAGVKAAETFKGGETKNIDLTKYSKSQTDNEQGDLNTENIVFTDTVINDEKVSNTTEENANAAEQENTMQATRTSSDKDYTDFVKRIDNIYNGEQGKRVFLTFDDGPSKSVTVDILNLLKFHNIKANFFVLGSRVKLNPSIVKRAYEEGHYIANHGYSHKYSSIYAKPENVLEEYNKTEEEIRKAIGDSNYSSHLFRFPGGSTGGEYSKVKKEAKKQLRSKQIAYLDWNALTSDAAGANTKQKILRNMKKTVGNYQNVVLLMHDAPDKKLTYETLEEVITYLIEKGYSFKCFNQEF